MTHFMHDSPHEGQLVADDTLQQFEEDLQHLILKLREASTDLEQGLVEPTTSQMGQSLLDFSQRFAALTGRLHPGATTLLELREALEQQRGHKILQQGMAIRGDVPLEGLHGVILPQLDLSTPQEEVVTATQALLTLIQRDDLELEEMSTLMDRAEQVFPKIVVLAASRQRLRVGEPGKESEAHEHAETTPSASEDEPSTPSQMQTEEVLPLGDSATVPGDIVPLPLPKQPPLPDFQKSVEEFKQAKKEGQNLNNNPQSKDSKKQYKQVKSFNEQIVTLKNDQAPVPRIAHEEVKEDFPSITETVSEEQMDSPDDSPDVPNSDEQLMSENNSHLQEINEAKSVDVKPDESWRPFIWSAIGRHNISLAYHAAKQFQVLDPDPTALRFALLGRNLLNAGDDLKDAFLEELELDPQVERWDAASAILAFSGLLPASLSDSRGASLALSVIQRLTLPGDLHHLRSELDTLVTGMWGRSFIDELHAARAYLQWLREEELFKHRLQDELRTAPLRTINFAPATKVWKTFWYPDGLLNKIVSSALNSARGIITPPSITEDEIEKIIQQKHQENNPKRRDAIDFSGLRQLHTRVQEALNLVREFANHRADEPQVDHNMLGIVEFARRWSELRPDTKSVDLRQSPEEQAAMKWLDSRLDALTDVINGQRNTEVYSLKDTVGRALLRASIPMTEQGEPRPDDELLAKLLTALKTDTSWDEAFDEYLRSGDLESAWLVIKEVEGDKAEYERRWRLAVDEQRLILQRLLEEVRQLFDVSSYQGLLTESEIQRFEQRLTDMRRFINDGAGRVNYGHLQRDAMDHIEHLERAFGRRIEALQQRLTALTLEPEVVSRIQQKLNEKDVQTAQEYLGYAERREELPNVDETSAAQFSQFFPGMLEAIDRYLNESRSEQKVIADLRSRSPRYVPDITALPGAQINGAADLLSTWFEVKRNQQQFGPTTLRRMFESLGFTVQQTAPHRIPGSNPPAWQLETVPVADRAIIPVEHYGSRAEGRYRVIPVWERPSEESVINMIGSSPLPTFILYFGRFSQQRRRDLAVMARERRRVVIVIDELLIMALTGIRGSRLPVLFRLGMPFSAFEPYTVTGSNVSPEMFFGREQEIHDILDPRGASFLYGGRQLGKSALLRHVERMHNQPQTGNIVRWVDLKSKEVGHGQSPDYIWTVLMRELQPFGVFSERYSNPKPEQFQRAVKGWLDESPSRRILLLLDEADQFLRSDGEKLINGVPAYTNAAQLKNLMEDTDRRFKVVFAGTHNVLKAHRTSTSANSPLVHLGHPIEIGPMLGALERRQAYALITDPFALQGYRFEPADLPYRILARTNYYPSLIQIYGHHLMRYLQGKRTQLPFTIRSEHIDGVFRDRELAKDIRDRLLWTLRLDLNGRYEAIAYALAEAAVRGAVNLEVGVSAEQLHKLASYWHPDGFAQTDRQEMRAVVEEMMGLGILRETQEDIYTFRTPNVALMLGSGREIETALLDLQERHSRQAELGPVSHRSVLNQHPTHASPLTSKQLFELIGNQNGVKIVVATEATNSRHLEEFLVENVGHPNVIVVPVHSDLTKFKTFLDRELGRREAHKVYLIPSDTPWTPEWVRVTQEKLKRFRDRSVTRFIFLGTPSVLADSAEFGDDLIMASPWNTYELHSWLESQGHPSGIETCRAIEAVTGNWPVNLQLAFKELARVSLSEVLGSAAERFSDPAWIEQRKSELGLSKQQMEVLRVLVEAGDNMVASASDLLALCEQESPWSVDDVQNALDTAVSLHIASDDHGFYRTSPYIKRLLA